ncbi:MAG: NTP transferase domain-containing protein [Bacteroidales bacterium]|nr:NTP transferase domain-containing protein [Candidatus Liminaster caballi]
MKNALIFAAGLGTRLRPLTNDRPKALVEVNGKPLLQHNIEKLRDAGFDCIVVNVHHFGQQIIDFLHAHRNFGIDIRVSDERDLLLDTGGGLLRALSMFDDDSPVLVHNVDIVSQADVRALYDDHVALSNRMAQSGGELGASLMVNQRQTSRYLLFDGDLRLRGWKNIQSGETRGDGSAPQMRAFSGIHVVSRALINYLKEYSSTCSTQDSSRPAGSPSPVNPFAIIPFYLWVCQRVAVQGVEMPRDVKWVDCGKVESLTKAAEILL